MDKPKCVFPLETNDLSNTCIGILLKGDNPICVTLRSQICTGSLVHMDKPKCALPLETNDLSNTYIGILLKGDNPKCVLLLEAKSVQVL